MVSINYSSREVCCKIVYYGPGLSGKTTNLQYVHSKVPGKSRGDLISLATEADRTLYFDFLPINIGSINGFAARFQLYTVPGQVYYNATRKLVLRGVDGLVFVADSQPDKMEENIESLSNLEDNLREYGYDVSDMPVVIQYNKRDLPGVLTIDQLNARLNPRHWQHFGASATIGNGVFDTLKTIIKLVLEKTKRTSTSQGVPPSVAVPQPVAAESVAAQSVTADETPSPAVEAPSPVAAPQPVAAVAQSAPAAVAEVASSPLSKDVVPLTAPEPQTDSPVAQSQQRPFPGNDTTGIGPKKISAASFTPVSEDEVAAETYQRNVVHTDGETEAGVGSPDLTAPTMAPPLRRRGDGKKRGFFKRLFGIR